MNSRNFGSYDDALKDLQSLLIEIQTFNESVASVSSTSSSSSELKQEHYSSSEAAAPSSDNEFEEFKNVDLNPAPAPASLSQADDNQAQIEAAVREQLQLDGVAEEDQKAIAEALLAGEDVVVSDKDQYYHFLTANQKILADTIKSFYANDFQINDDNISIITRACAHFSALERGRLAGEILHKYIFNSEKNLISTFLIDSGADVNFSRPVGPEGLKAANEVKVATLYISPECTITTLIRCLYLNPDRNLIKLLIHHGARDDADFNAVKISLVHCDPDITGFLLNFAAIKPIRDALDQLTLDPTNPPFMIGDLTGGLVPENAKKAKENLLFSMYRIEESRNYGSLAYSYYNNERESYTFDYSAEDKHIFYLKLKEKIESAITVKACLEIYDQFARSGCLTYQRYGFTFSPSTSYAKSKSKFIDQVQYKIFSLRTKIDDIAAAKLLAEEALKHDAFSVTHLVNGINDLMSKEIAKVLEWEHAKPLNLGLVRFVDDRIQDIIHIELNAQPLPLAQEEEVAQAEVVEPALNNPAPAAAVASNIGAGFRSFFSYFTSSSAAQSAPAQQANAIEFEMKDMGNSAEEAEEKKEENKENEANQFDRPRLG